VKRLTQKNNVLSLFSGCGGLDLGFAQAGANSLDLEIGTDRKRRPSGTLFDLIWSNDIYKPSCKSYSANFDAEIYTDPNLPYEGKHRVYNGDIAEIFFERAVGKQKIDVVLGGFPCQDFSLIRGTDKRLGVSVKRGRLYCHFVRALVALQPKLFVAENVRGLVSANKGLAYKYIIDDFENLNVRWNEIETSYENHSFEEKTDNNTSNLKGYKILFSKVVSFKNLGVPQARERLIIIGLRKDLLPQSISSIVEELENRVTGDKSLLSTFPLTPLEVLNGKDLSHLQNDYKKILTSFNEKINTVSSDRQKEYTSKIWPKYQFDIWSDYFWLNKNGGGKPENKSKSTLKHQIEKCHISKLKELGFCEKPVELLGEIDDESNAVLNEGTAVKNRMSHIPPGENHEFVRGTQYHVTGLMSNIYKRINPLKPSPTIIARGGGGTWGYHYFEDRQRMTNRERARIQTFPDTFIFKGKPGEVRRQIGEAVPPLAGKVIAESLSRLISRL
jgi:DNA (cytosine-5)-methyltransferase 1